MQSEIKSGPVERLYTIIAVIIGVVVLFSLVGRIIDVTLKPAPNVIVYADEKNHIYYAPPYINGKKYPSTLDVNSLKAETMTETINNNHTPDSTCVELGYFKEQTTLTDNILVKMGLEKPKPSRWNPDGSWNW